MKTIRSYGLCLLASLAVFASPAQADDQTVSFVSNVASFTSMGTVLAGGADHLTFSGAVTGARKFSLTFSGQDLNLSSITLNGISGTLVDTGKWTFAGIEGVSSPTFSLLIQGTTDGSTPVYSGDLTISPVPEPQTYALMLAGIGMMMFLARRRRFRLR